MKLYVYCLIDDSAPNLVSSTANEGIAGSPLSFLCLGDFNLLVSDFAGSSVPPTRDNVLKHAAVVSSVLTETTPLPFRFGTLATKQDLQSYLTARHDTLRARLTLVRGCVEMSVKIIGDRDRIEEPAQASDAQEGPGTAFLAEKRRQILGSEARAEEAKSVASWLQHSIGDLVREARLDTNPTEKLLLAASHLVERDSLDLYRTRVTEARQERPELHFLVSGPWPPYSFANIDLEFKTQFGVS